MIFIVPVFIYNEYKLNFVVYAVKKHVSNPFNPYPKTPFKNFIH